ncbi:MAG: UdgX family uracil-DNA binding protein, partial [Phycisphaerae bacterium]
MRWTILTPDASVAWDGPALAFGPGVPRREAPAPDELEDLWKRYYANIFNPARIKLAAMRAEMPRKHWATLPETEAIPQMLAAAPKRVELMMANARKLETTAADYLPADRSIEAMARAIEHCKGCELYQHATQPVFGEGDPNATTVFVGEVPGDQEDLAGRPFVGPAGQLLDDLLARAGVDRSRVYVTNTVKHFKFEQRGKHRLHVKPSAREIAACVPWLEAEVVSIAPRVLVCLGATAAQAVFGRGFRITRDRGRAIETTWAPFTLAALHPSALLRMPDPAAREQAEADFVADMKQVARAMAAADA